MWTISGAPQNQSGIVLHIQKFYRLCGYFCSQSPIILVAYMSLLNPTVLQKYVSL